MTPDRNQLALDIIRARQFLGEICKGAIPPMRIPVQDDDFDMVFKRVIDAAEAALITAGIVKVSK